VVSPGGRKIVLDLLVDRDQARLSRKTRDRIEENMRGVEKWGLACHVAHREFVSIEGFVRHLSGLLAFAADLEPAWAQAMTDRWRATLRENHWLDFVG
jgi:RNA-directed DNA polymerase